MKCIKTIFGVLAIASLFAFPANAQENGNRDENGKTVKGAYATNRGRDNWFIGLGAGANTFGAKDVTPKFGGVAAEGFIGKWFTPSVGARVGYKGFKNSFDSKYLEPNVNQDYNEWDQHYVHADFLWNISNAISGYKETRFWDIIPYAEFGVLIDKPSKSDNNLEFASGIGFLNDFRLGKHVDLYLDLSCAVARDQAFYTDNGDAKFAFLPAATAGLIFNLGRSNFDRVSSIMPVVVPVPFTVDQYNALKDRVAQLEKENAALKNEIEALKNQAPDTVYVGSDANVASPATIYFDCGSTKISDRERAHLDFYIENVLGKSDKAYTVTGSADKATGSARRNMQLSQQRADNVKAYIVKKGIDAERLTVKAIGDTNQRFAENALNRVVVIE